MPLAILLIPLFIFLVVFILFSISAFFHIVRFELLSITSIMMTAIFIAGAFFIGTVSTSYLQQIDWSEHISFSDIPGYRETQEVQNNVLSF